MTPNDLYSQMVAAGYDSQVSELASVVLRGRDVPARTDALYDLLNFMGVIGPREDDNLVHYDPVMTPEGPAAWLNQPLVGEDGVERWKVLMDDGAHAYFPREQITRRPR